MARWHDTDKIDILARNRREYCNLLDWTIHWGRLQYSRFSITRSRRWRRSSCPSWVWRHGTQDSGRIAATHQCFPLSRCDTTSGCSCAGVYTFTYLWGDWYWWAVGSGLYIASSKGCFEVYLVFVINSSIEPNNPDGSRGDSFVKNLKHPTVFLPLEGRGVPLLSHSGIFAI